MFLCSGGPIADSISVTHQFQEHLGSTMLGWLEVIFEICPTVLQLALTLCSENIKFVRFSEK